MSSIVYSYKHGFSGFAAMLTESQADKIAGSSFFNFRPILPVTMEASSNMINSTTDENNPKDTCKNISEI